MTDIYTKEITELHQFFEDWFSAKLDKTQTKFARFADTVSEGFVLISPAGTLTHRTPLLEGLYEAHGNQPNSRLWIENVQVRYQDGDITLVIYEEWQDIDGKITARHSSALFKTQVDTPNGIAWLHVHETWLPEYQPKTDSSA